MESSQSFSECGDDNTVVSQFPPPPPELLEEADEMVAAERELAQDAQWKKIQQNTFTRWVNEHLKTVSKHVGNLETDLADGLRLLALVEVLSGKKIPRFNKRPMIISQKIENVTIALKFLETDEGIKLVNIDSSDIFDCKLKLILGLIWTLILHYSISLPMWDGEVAGEKGPTPKQRLLGWIQNKCPDLPIHNFTTDWNDGRAVGALVDAVAPGLCPDWPDWNSKDALQNATEAMGLADDWLRIPQLIKPEEMIDPKVDELSMMTYLSQYPHAKVQPGAPLRPRTNPGRVRVYGPGVEPTGPVVGAPAPFSIETFAAGKGNVEVAVTGPKGESLPVDVKFNNDRSLTYSASYTPKQEGPHKIVVRFAEKDVPRSPFDVKVEGFAGEASKVTVSGPGIEMNGVVINRPTYFDIFTKEAGKGTPEVAVLDAAGQRSNQVKLRPISPDVWRCEYVSQQLGLHSVNVFFAGKPIPGSPFGVKVSPVSDARRVRAWGRGLQPTGVRVKDTADFKIYTEGAGEGNLDIKIIGPGGVAEPVKVRRIDATTCEAAYMPKKEGRYVVAVQYGGQEIPRSPFEVNVGPYKESRIYAFGPGLEGGVVGHPALFTVETNGETGALGFSIEGPSQAKIDCQDNNDGSADVKYYPSIPGDYAVHIMCNNEDIPGSPFMATILPSTVQYHPDKVVVQGPGVEKHGVISNKQAEFTVDARAAGSLVPVVTAMDREYRPVDVNMNATTPGLFNCSYVPKKGVKHTVQVNYGGVATQNSPYRVFVSDPTDPNKVRVFGPGVERGVKTKTPTHFNVDCRDAGPGQIQVSVANEKGQDIPISVIDNQDGSYTVEYSPLAPGKHTVNVLYAGKSVPQTPVQVNVAPHVDINKVRVEGLEPTVTIHALQQFRVLTEFAGSGELALTLTSPSGKKLRPQTIPTKEGYLVNYMPTELGEYTLDATFGGEQLGQFPKRILCTLPGGQAGQVRAYGAGLLSGIVEKPAEFIIDTRGAGQGGLGVTVEGPCEASIQCKDNGDGTCAVAYLPTEEGEYAVNISFNDAPIPGSPFQAIVKPAVDLTKVKVYGPGIQPKGTSASMCMVQPVEDKCVFVESPTEFVVDSRPVGSGRLQCILTSPSGARVEAPVTPLADGQQKVTYTPFEEGRHQVDVTYDGVPIPGSPFPVTAQRGCDPRKCRAYGQGLLKGIVEQMNAFTVETKGAGAGGLGLAIEGPSEARMTCKDNRDGSCTVEYIPLEEGDYDISVKFAEQHISGSPFKVAAERVADPNAVRAYGPGLDPKNCRAGVPQKFRIDATKSGKAPLAVELKSDKGQPQQKPEVKDNGDGTYDVSYLPPAEGSNCKIRVTHAGKDIPKSPFELKVRPKVEPHNVKVTGPGVSSKGVPASLPVDFTIDTTEAGFADLEVQVLGPDGYPRKVKIADNGDGTFKATYVPDDVGQYKVKVKYGGKEVPHAPFPVQAYAIGKAERCKITEGKQQALTLGEEYCITVNAKQAGHGAVTCKIRSTQGSDLDIDIEDNGDGTFSIFYNVKDAGEYTISVKFGGQPVPDGFYTFTAGGEEFAKQSSVPQQNNARNNVEDQYRPVELQNIPLPSTGGNVTAEVRMPSGAQDSPVIVDNRDGTVSIRYDPREEGLHELHVKYNTEHVQGSPFKFHVDEIKTGLVTAYGSGLTHGICGEQSKFTISTQGAGTAGGLSLAVEGPSKAEISCHDNKDGTVSVSYLPTAPGEYKVAVKFADKHIKGSPYTAKITGEGRRRNQISVGSSSEVPLPGRVTDAELKLLSATILSPTGIEEPCFLKRLNNGNLGVSFTPRDAGDHHVSVKKMGKHIANSPFKITVGEKQVGDARKVKLTGAGLREGKTHAPNTFKIDTRDAGYGGLSLSIEGPSKAEIDCKDNEDGTLDISYKPTEPGYYIVNLKFADHHVDGSPFTVKVTGEGSNKQTERIKKQREAVPVTEVGSKCRLQFKLPGVTPRDLGATVSSPKGIVEDCSIMPTDDDGFAVDFVPKELGVHTVSVKCRDMHIPGSPFQFTVGPLKESGSHRVRAGGPGLERGEVGESCEFNVWTREAGAGSLAISVEGPSKAEIDFKDRKDGSCYVSYRVSEPGEYRVGIKFNELNIPDSPYRVYITPATGDAHKVEVGQFPDVMVKSGKPQAFIVRKCGARGDFDAKVVSPSGVEDDCFISPIVEDETYSVRFVPHENGIHNIHVKFNGIHIPGSPFKLKVGDEDADPAAIKVTGEGIVKSVSGHKSEFVIDTSGTGTGTLAVTIDGPSKVSVNCSEVDEGYKVRYTPLLPGDYFISVKYNDTHIPLSPFKVKCTGDKLAEGGIQETSSVIVETVKKYAKGVVVGKAMPVFKSDASKVTTKGMGLKKSYLNKQNTFAVQGTDAGNNMLFCGVYGPKGPVEEVYIKHIGRNNYNVNYVARDRGDHVIVLKWGDDHVPGSPFRVDVL